MSSTRSQKVCGALALSLCALVAPRSLHATVELERNGFDTDDLAALNRKDPALAALLLRGERELRQSSLQAAADTFKEVIDGAPQSALAERRYCQALTELGKRREAIEACQLAIGKRQSAPAFRALVGALMSAPPTPDDLNMATQLAHAAERRLSDQPWGLAAKAEIAERTGDEKMLANTVLELERIAPGHYETRRARRALNTFGLPTWAWATWLGLGAGVFATLAHLGWSGTTRLRTRRRMLKVATPAALALATLLAAGHASADTPPATSASAAPAAAEPEGLSQWPINDANPKKSVPTTTQRDGNPLEFGYHLMDLVDKADIAKKKGDWAAVGKYYEAVATAVPDRAIGYRRSCEGYERAGDPEKALDMCRSALGADGIEIGDYTHYAKLVMAKEGKLLPLDVDDLDAIVPHLKAEQGGMIAALQIQCDLAQRLDDVKRLEDCARAVSKDNPGDPKLVVYEWGVAMKHEDYRRARDLVGEARKGPLGPTSVAVMERMTGEQSAISRRALRALYRHPLGVVVLFTVLGALGVGLMFRRRFALHLRTS